MCYYVPLSMCRKTSVHRTCWLHICLQVLCQSFVSVILRGDIIYNSVRMLREELQLLQEQGSYVGEVVKAMDKKKVLVKVWIVNKHFVLNRIYH